MLSVKNIITCIFIITALCLVGCQHTTQNSASVGNNTVEASSNTTIDENGVTHASNGSIKLGDKVVDVDVDFEFSNGRTKIVIENVFFNKITGELVVMVGSQETGQMGHAGFQVSSDSVKLWLPDGVEIAKRVYVKTEESFWNIKSNLERGFRKYILQQDIDFDFEAEGVVHVFEKCNKVD